MQTIFMRITAQHKNETVKRVLKGKESITILSKELGVARKTIYSWVRRYQKTAPRNKHLAFNDRYTIGKSHPKEYRHTLKDALVRQIKHDSSLNVTEIAQKLKTGRHAVYNLLKELKLTTRTDRENFASLYRSPGILDLNIKISITRAIDQKEKTVSQVSREFGVSRKAVYAWLKDFQLNGKVVEKYLLGNAHPRALGVEVEEQILAKVVAEPSLSIHSLSKVLNYSGHGIYNVLKRYGLTYKHQRLQYALTHSAAEKPTLGFWPGKVKSILERFIPSLAPAPPPSTVSFLKYFSGSLITSFLLSFGLLKWFTIVSKATSVGNGIGLFFASIALVSGSLFFLYSLKYYLTLAIVLSFSQKGLESGSGRTAKKGGILAWLLGQSGSSGWGGGPRKAIGLEPDLDYIHLKKHPYISVHIPFYNEKNVVERAMRAATNFDYPSYEVILCDDSTDETSDIITRYQKDCLFKGELLNVIKGDGWSLTSVEIKPGVILKHLHRTTRYGFKGAALELARTLVDPKTEFISVFDADFVPYPDSLELFLKYFKAQNNMSEDYKSSNVAAVQGYQWHVLNKSENWVTRGVRSEYSGSYVIERSGTEIYGGLKQISGSVYMIRRDVLDEIKWGSSITEDFELTLKLYNAGYKVLYTPYVQAPAECVSTVKRLIRQRMRWAEGHSQNIKMMFGPLMFNSKLSLAEKFELVYLSPYYLQAFFFLLGTLSWLISETLFPARLPFWTELWGWSLVLTNMIALPLVNAVGMFLEESEGKDYAGIGSFIALSYLVVPFQAYAAVKGFLEKEEGTWFRTPKTGKITDIFSRGKFYRFIQGFLPNKASAPVKTNLNYGLPSQYLALSTANSQFNSFNLRPKKARWVGRAFLSFVLIVSLCVNSLAFWVRPAKAAGWLDGWTKRVMLTLDQTDIDADLTYFPVLVHLSAISGRNADDVSFVFDELTSDANRLKIAVTKDDGTTEIYVEIEKWDDANEQAWLWVSKSDLVISGTVDTVLYLYYDSTHADNTTYVTDSGSRTEVWDTYYEGVWTLREDPQGVAPQMKDSTSNNNDGTSQGTMLTADQVAGQVDGSLDFEGTNDAIAIAQTSGLPIYRTSGYSISVWVSAAANQSDKRLFSEGDTSTAYTIVGLGTNSGNNKLDVYIRNDTNTVLCNHKLSTTVVYDSTWHHVYWTDSNGTAKVYVDGNLDATNFNYTVSGTVTPNTTTIAGLHRPTWSNFIAGKVDQVEISSTVRPAAWAKATYQSEVDNLVDFGTEEIPELSILFLPLALAIPFLVKNQEKKKRAYSALTLV